MGGRPILSVSDIERMERELQLLREELEECEADRRGPDPWRREVAERHIGRLRHCVAEAEAEFELMVGTAA